LGFYAHKQFQTFLRVESSFFLLNSNIVCKIRKKFIYFSLKSIFIVEMKNSLVRDLPGILSAFSIIRNLVFTYYRHFKGTD
jgi:hypothetical protein